MRAFNFSLSRSRARVTLTGPRVTEHAITGKIDIFEVRSPADFEKHRELIEADKEALLAGLQAALGEVEKGDSSADVKRLKAQLDQTAKDIETRKQEQVAAQARWNAAVDQDDLDLQAASAPVTRSRPGSSTACSTTTCRRGWTGASRPAR
jgi:hypothetical protein